MDYISVKDAADKWNISMRRVQKLCEEGRIWERYALGTSGCSLRTQKSLKMAGIKRG